MRDRASQVLAQGCPAGVPNSFRALADHGDVPRTTLQHRARGRRSLQDKAQSQQYLRTWEEKALVRFLIQQDALGRPVRIKYAFHCLQSHHGKPRWLGCGSGRW